MSIFKFKTKRKITITGEKIFDIWNITPLHQISNVISIDYKEYYYNNEYRFYAEVGFMDSSACEYTWTWKPQGGGYWSFRCTIKSKNRNEPF